MDLCDVAVPADEQLRFAADNDGCEVVDIDAGHMCMVSQPSKTAGAVNLAAEA